MAACYQTLSGFGALVLRHSSVGLQRLGGDGVSLGFRGRALVAVAAAGLGSLLTSADAWADACKAKPAQAFLGKPYTESLRDRAQAAAHASLVEALRRGEATTAEFRGDRLDMIIDPKTDVVIGLWCG
jgi:hypothetical protein